MNRDVAAVPAVGLVVGAPVIVGAVLSTLIPELVVLALLPAASVTEPVADWFAPWPTVCAVEQVATPESASPHVKETVTSALYQPLAFGARSRAEEMVGSVLSMLTFAGSVALLPALSTAVPVAAWFAPSLEIVKGAVQLAIPDTPSAQVKVTVTFVLFQPFAFADGDWM